MRVVQAITGASGAPSAARLLESPIAAARGIGITPLSEIDLEKRWGS